MHNTNQSKKYRALLSASIALVLQISSGQIAYASDRPQVIEAGVATAFIQQNKKIAEWRVSTSDEQRLRYARLLAAGTIQNEHNPLKIADLTGAAALYRELTKAESVRFRHKAMQEFANLLKRIGGAQNLDEAARIMKALEADLGASGKSSRLVNNTTKTEEELASTVEKLKNDMADGSITSGFDLLELLRENKSSELDTMRKQVIYLAKSAAVDSDSEALKYAVKYLRGKDVDNNLKIALELIAAAAANGSDAAVSLMEDNFDRFDKSIGRDALKGFLWNAMRNGSSRAAELIALDLGKKQTYGFDKDDSLWAVDQLSEVKSSRANYLLAKLYFDGVYVPKDIEKAKANIEAMIETARADPKDVDIAANRLLQIDMPPEMMQTYVLPLFLKLWKNGKSTAINRIASIIVNGEKAGLYPDLTNLPLEIGTVIAALEQNNLAGDDNAGIILGDIYRDGRLIKSDTVKAMAIYDQLLARQTRDTSFITKVKVRLAKAVRHDLEATLAYSRYYKILEELIASSDPWAMKEYGSLLVKGAEQLNADRDKGFALLLTALRAGYFPAGRAAAEIIGSETVRAGDGTTKLKSTEAEDSAVAIKNKLVLTQIEQAYSKVDIAKLEPSDKASLASVNLGLNEYEKALTLLDDPQVSELPAAQFMAAQIKLITNKISSTEAARLMGEVIANAKASDATTLNYIKKVMKLDGIEPHVEAKILDRLGKIADRNDIDAVLYAFKLLEDGNKTIALDFDKLLKWADAAAQQGRSDPLTKLTVAGKQKRFGVDDRKKLVDLIEKDLGKLPQNGQLRVFLAKEYLAGKTRSLDREKAAVYVKQAAKFGNLEALYLTAVNLNFGIGYKRDEKAAFELNRSLSSIGSNRSRLYVARGYSRGPVFEVNETRAFAYYLAAANQGSMIAKTEIGRSYLAGAGVNQDDEAGIKALKEASGLGDSEADLQLYYYYFLKNQGQDNAAAEKWLDRLVEKKIPSMMIRKAVLLNSRDPVNNRTAAFALLDEAAANGNSFARRIKNKILKDAEYGK